MNRVPPREGREESKPPKWAAGKEQGTGASYLLPFHALDAGISLQETQKGFVGRDQACGDTPNAPAIFKDSSVTHHMDAL